MKQFLLISAAGAYKHPRPIFDLLVEMKPKSMTEDNLSRFAQHSAILSEDPNLAFGEKTTANFFNTRTGEIPGFEIDMHNDEPIIMGEANMDDSSESGSDGEETEEDREYMREALKKMDSRVQVRSYNQIGEKFYDNTL